MDIALAHARDAAAIARLSRNAIEHGLPWRWRPAKVASCIAQTDTNVVLARNGGEMAGFGLMQYGEDMAHLLLLAVLPATRRRGYGRALLAWLEKTALVAGIGEVHVEVRLGNSGARRFYTRLGYREMGRLKGYYQGREDALRLQKDLWCRVAADR